MRVRQNLKVKGEFLDQDPGEHLAHHLCFKKLKACLRVMARKVKQYPDKQVIPEANDLALQRILHD